MNIRTNKNTKDRLSDIPVVLQQVPALPIKTEVRSLRFRTQHPTKPTDVDLTVFATGQVKGRGRGRLHNGPFKGRPELIEQLAPAIEDRLSPLAAKSVFQHLHALRTWWRLMDAIEREMPIAQPVASVAHLSDLHRQRAMDDGMSRLPFGNFLLHVNDTRLALGLKELVWQRPAQRYAGARTLPPEWQSSLLKRELKHGWFAIVDRWELADTLLATRQPVADGRFAHTVDRQLALLKGYLRLQRAIESTKHPRPGVAYLQEPGDKGKKEFYADGVLLMDILRGRYPDGEDIRMAFHLCLATTGWNPAVFLALDANEPFIEPHPRSPSRYVLRGVKDRAAGAEQVAEGLFKSQGSAGFILQTLLQRTAPLRAELVRLRAALLDELAANPGVTDDEQAKLRSRIDQLAEGIRSPWLFVSHVGEGIHWLSDGNFAGSTQKKTSFLSDIIDGINARRPHDRRLEYITPTDFRDIHAAQVYHANGGSILAVMKALGHKSLGSTQAYIDNTLLNEEHRKLFGTFSDAFWDELAATGRVDPTLLAKISRDGSVSSNERARLDAYRTLLRSRIGVGCKEPTNPPKHIAPDFVPDGKKLCHVQRCLLCLEHAVLLPESLDGLCKRASELEVVRSGMSVTSWEQSSFAEEFMNTELALSLFDQAASSASRAEWAERINIGAHVVPEFDGSTEGQ